MYPEEPHIQNDQHTEEQSDRIPGLCAASAWHTCGKGERPRNGLTGQCVWKGTRDSDSEGKYPQLSASEWRTTRQLVEASLHFFL